MRIPLLLNWELNPYHAPIIVAQELGFYKQYDIELSLLQPTDPSDVTKLIGTGEIPLGLKAMIHCVAARKRGYKLTSIGTLLDEPPTGLISLKEKEMTCLQDIKGKRIGYVGEFGKVMVDQLAKEAGIDRADYHPIRIGMDATTALLTKEVDAAIGLSCFQQIEVEAAGQPCNFLRLDDLADLGCCCFCSIMLVANEEFLYQEQELLTHFMKATHLGMQFTREQPQQAYDCLVRNKRELGRPVYEKIFYSMLSFFSKEMLNNERDWQKVRQFGERLGILSNMEDIKTLYTNEFVPHPSMAASSVCMI